MSLKMNININISNLDSKDKELVLKKLDFLTNIYL